MGYFFSNSVTPNINESGDFPTGRGAVGALEKNVFWLFRLKLFKIIDGWPEKKISSGFETTLFNATRSMTGLA